MLFDVGFDFGGGGFALFGGERGFQVGFEFAERRVAAGVLCLTVGTGGAPRSDGDEFTPVSDDAVRSLAVFGTLRVDVARGRVAYAFIDSAGRTRDRFTGPAR